MKLSRIFSVGTLVLAFLGATPVVKATLLINGGFEDYSLAAHSSVWDMSTAAAPGWHTTQPDGKIELWSNGFYGVSSYEGSQFIEINANEPATVFQDVSGLLQGMQLDFSFAHRGRVTDEPMKFSITDLGTDGIFGTADDITLFSQVYTDGTSSWGTYAGSGITTTSADTVRFSFEALNPGSYGNFLDAVQVTATASAPEPGTWAAIAFLVCVAYGSTLKSLARRRAVRVQ